MRWLSLSLILPGIFLGYIVYLIYTLTLLFVVPSCEGTKPCIASYLNERPHLRLQMYSSVRNPPSERELKLVYVNDDFDYHRESSFELDLSIPRETQRNGTLFLHVVLLSDSKKYRSSFSELRKDPYMAYTLIEVTRYAVPEAETFNLLGSKELDKKKKKKNIIHPVTHLQNDVTFTIMTENVKIPVENVPMELLNHLKIIHGRTFVPIVSCDYLQLRQRNLVQITPQNNTANITIRYTPITFGKLRFTLHVIAAMQGLINLGFSDKDIDEVKGFFADTNIYLLGGTFFISAVHLLFDFLAFKNDISFWRKKDNLVGLSKWTIVWRTFSQTVIFLYLLDAGSSLLILIPTGVGFIIEVWKLRKVLKLRANENMKNISEMRTRQFDAESMRYLSYILYPLVIGGAIYSLLYLPHKSWYSWSITSLVNGVYAFGFLFMLPQLFVNYKLKSVAQMPWRTFMYKAFNTFIDDLFAFLINMPTAHRIACFRDDAVFLVYLYQRWLYPVDKSRIDLDTVTEEFVDYRDSRKKTD